MATQQIAFTQYFIRDTDEYSYCLACARRLSVHGIVEVVSAGYGEPINVCSWCNSVSQNYCTCGRRSRAISGPNGRACHCHRPEGGETR